MIVLLGELLLLDITFCCNWNRLHKVKWLCLFLHISRNGRYSQGMIHARLKGKISMSGMSLVFTITSVISDGDQKGGGIIVFSKALPASTGWFKYPGRDYNFTSVILRTQSDHQALGWVRRMEQQPAQLKDPDTIDTRTSAVTKGKTDVERNIKSCKNKLEVNSRTNDPTFKWTCSGSINRGHAVWN